MTLPARRHFALRRIAFGRRNPGLRRTPWVGRASRRPSLGQNFDFYLLTYRKVTIYLGREIENGN